MTDNPRTDPLQSLTKEAGRVLRARARRLASLPTLALSQDPGSRKGISPAAPFSPGTASGRRRHVPGGATAGLPEIETPREERSVRALAKEIKRLLTEDRRRGLGIGG